jgi:hypothetical protein
MGFFRTRVGVIQRSKGGSLLRRSAYQSCTRVVTPEGRVFDWSGAAQANGHVSSFMIAPPGSPEWATNREECWRKAVAKEVRCDAQEARTLEIALPRELPPNLWEPCARALVAPFISAGMVAQGDIHAPRASDGKRQPHVHLSLSLRRVDGDDFSRKKQRNWNRIFYPDLKKIRADIAKALNDFCAAHGVPYWADARSNRERGLPAPMPTLPRWNILSAKRSGVLSDWMKHRDEERIMRSRLAAFEAALAAVNDSIRVQQDAECARATAVAPIAVVATAVPDDSQRAARDGRRVGRRMDASTEPAHSHSKRPSRDGLRPGRRTSAARQSICLDEASPDRMPWSNRAGPAALAPEAEPPAPPLEDFASPAQISM